MKPIISYETLRSFAYSNDRLCAGKIRGIVLAFQGLGAREMFSADPADGLWFAGRNIAYLIPYCNPWCWMNRQAVAFTDEIVKVLLEHYGLSETTPIVSTGGSMGGQCALVYMVYARITPAACAACCPVCDLPYHFTERPDLPRTLYSAFFSEEGELTEALKTASPLHLADRMPDADYFLFTCGEDLAVKKEMHADRFAAAMKGSHRVTCWNDPGRGHCDLSPELREIYRGCAAEAIDRRCR